MNAPRPALPGGATLIFANPIAGQGQAATLAHRLVGVLGNSGRETHLFFQDPREVDCRAVQNAAAAIVIGGDGTLREVVRLLLGAMAEPPPLLLVPMGTANLMARHLRLDWSPSHPELHILRALDRPRWQYLDVAQGNGAEFLLMAGVGLDASVVHAIHRRRSGPITRAAYVAPILAALWQYEFVPLQVNVDQRMVFAGAPALAFVANVGEYGAGFMLMPQARSDDSWLDVCVLPCNSARQAVQHWLAALAGEHLENPGVVCLRGRHVRIDSPQTAPVQFDGEPAGCTPLEIVLSPRRIRFIVAAAAA